MIYEIQTLIPRGAYGTFSQSWENEEHSSADFGSTKREGQSWSPAHLPNQDLPAQGQSCGEETRKQAAPSNNSVKKRLLQVQALLFLTLCGALWSCFAWDSKDSKVSSIQGSQRLNKFKMTCPASWGVMPLCIAFCAGHSFLMRAFIDGIISI